MYLHTFPGCCGAGILVVQHLTGKGEVADYEEFKRWIYFARRNGFRMYDYFSTYGGTSRGITQINSLDNPGDQKTLNYSSGWGMLLVITTIHQKEIETRIEGLGKYLGDEKKYGFIRLPMDTPNPYSGGYIKLHLWGLDLTKHPEEILKPKELTPVAPK